MKNLRLSTSVKITKLVPGGQGIGTVENVTSTSPTEHQRLETLIGKKGFFWGALPGETVEVFTITKNKSHYFEAIAEKISQPSSHRIEPKDDCYLATSPWQIMDYDYELEQKSDILVETFRQAGINIQANPKVVTDGRDFYYRNKMEYSLYWDISEETIRLAQHTRGSHRKLPLTTSSIERPEIFARAKAIVSDLNSRHEEARKYQSLLLRADKDGHISGGLYENYQPHPNFPPLKDTILGETYSYSPNGFFQINLPVYELALREIQKHVQTTDVLDLYSGVGSIGLSVAKGKSLTLVETNPNAYAELVQNVKAIGATWPTPPLALHQKSEEALEHIRKDQTVILDPPRSGCDKALIEKLNEVKPSTIIYLSCNPTTQARDVKLLSTNYQIQSLIPFNFFPRTPHLENLIILRTDE